MQQGPKRRGRSSSWTPEPSDRPIVNAPPLDSNGVRTWRRAPVW